MKNFILLAVLLFSVTLCFSQAQLDDNQSSKPQKRSRNKSDDNSGMSGSNKIFDFDFGFAGGIFLSNSSAANAIYGKVLPTGNINMTFWLKNISLRLDIYGMYKKGHPIMVSNESSSNLGSSCRLLMFPTTISVLYRFKYKNEVFNSFYPYIGIGAGINIVNESLKIPSLDFNSNITKYPLDLAATIGFKVKFVTLEGRYSRSIINASGGAGGSKCNVGGFLIELGFRW